MFLNFFAKKHSNIQSNTLFTRKETEFSVFLALKVFFTSVFCKGRGKLAKVLHKISKVFLHVYFIFIQILERQDCENLLKKKCVSRPQSKLIQIPLYRYSSLPAEFFFLQDYFIKDEIIFYIKLTNVKKKLWHGVDWIVYLSLN